MGKRVLVLTRDLFFRSKLQTLVQAGGGEVTQDEPYDLAVLELGGTGIKNRIRELVGRGVPVLAFGSHVQPDELREARALGARAVPNSEVEAAVRALL